jgi:hypothetical protein
MQCVWPQVSSQQKVIIIISDRDLFLGGDLVHNKLLKRSD